MKITLKRILFNESSYKLFLKSQPTSLDESLFNFLQLIKIQSTL